MNKTLAAFRTWLKSIGKGDDWTDAQLSSALAVMRDQQKKEGDSDATPGRMMIDQEKWDRIWHDRDSAGNRFVRFGIAISKPNS